MKLKDFFKQHNTMLTSEGIASSQNKVYTDYETKQPTNEKLSWINLTVTLDNGQDFIVLSRGAAAKCRENTDNLADMDIRQYTNSEGQQLWAIMLPQAVDYMKVNLDLFK